MRHIIIQEYLSSLKEDNELDFLFPLLLDNMGFKVISTPKNSKGQSQYGKDIVAIGIDENGKKWKWYFELKGYTSKDITEHTFGIEDGIRESLLEAKDIDFKSCSIPGFNELPTKYVLVHNGVLKENFRQRFESFIEKNFEKDSFERWGIEKLTELFSEHLFDEYLFADEESYILMKHTLVLLDTPSENYSSLNKLIQIQFNKCDKTSRPEDRKAIQLFSSLWLICSLIDKYSDEYNNLTPSKYCINLVTLKCWAFILKKKWNNNKAIVSKFTNLLNLQIEIYFKYINKTYSIASATKGLYSFGKTDTESVCYPLRCFQYLNDLLFFSFVCEYTCKSNKRKDLRKKQIQFIKKIVEANSGFDMALLDTNSITILYLISYIAGDECSDEDIVFIANYISRVIQNMIIRFRRNKMLPEIDGNEMALAHSLYNKSEDYIDDSSLLILNLAEIVAWLNNEELYELIKTLVNESGVDLQMVYPISNDELEIQLFEGDVTHNVATETSIKLPESIVKFQNTFRKECQQIDFKVDHTGFPYLKILAHMFYKIDLFPSEINFSFIEQ